jgi:hypothetical protein
MKISVKSVLFYILLVSFFTSCSTYEVMHYKRAEFDKVSGRLDAFTVYLHDEHNTYKINNPTLSVTGIKGQLTPITDPKEVAGIKAPRTPKEFRKHKHDLGLYTKTEIDAGAGNNATVLKNIDISDVTRIVPVKPAFDAGLYAQILGVLVYGVIVWVVIFDAFEGKL